MICDIPIVDPATLSLALRLGRQNCGGCMTKFTFVAAFIIKRVKMCSTNILQEGFLFCQ
jgi:hypothetical protein